MKKYSWLLVLISCTVMAQEESVINFALGDCTISTLSEGQNVGNSSILLGTTPEMLQKHLPDGTFSLQVSAFLVKADDKNILIDAGYGKKLFDNLKSRNTAPEQIDIILITHMHGDHIGGLLHEGKAAFPNAQLYISQLEHDYWVNTQNGAQARNVIAAYKDKLHLFVPNELGAENKISLLEDKSETMFKAIAAYGHTPGHTAFLIESNESQLLIWGDVAHALPIQMPCPEVALSFDVNPEQAIKTRKEILEYVSVNKIPVGGMHIEFPSIGDIKTDNGGYKFEPFCVCLGI